LSKAGRLAGLATMLFAFEVSSPAQKVDKDRHYSVDPAEKAACEKQLNILTGAIRKYQEDHGNTLPSKLSDLGTDYLHDRSVLTCPFVRKRGGLQIWKKQYRDLALDPHTSYSYEFSPEPMDYHQWRGAPKKTWRDWKERQVEQLGGVVPIVRCHDHRPWLNLAFDGQIYPSSAIYWERNFSTNDDLLTVANLFRVPPPVRPLTVTDFPPRDPKASVRLLDLTGSYNATLTNSWQGFPENHLATVPAGLQECDGVHFDVRGVIQLHGTELPALFPRKVTGIKVHQKCARIHFLHAVSFFYQPGTAQASYSIHYADGDANEFRVIYGKHIADWWFDSLNSASPTEAKVAWTGQNEAAKAYGMSLRLYHAVWENPRPEAEIATLTFDALPKQFTAGPFLVAITLE
jgi:hypothetical protein